MCTRWGCASGVWGVSGWSCGALQLAWELPWCGAGGFGQSPHCLLPGCLPVPQVIASGLSKLASVPSGGAVSAAPAAGGAAAAAAPAEKKEEEKEEEEEEEDMGFSLFD